MSHRPRRVGVAAGWTATGPAPIAGNGTPGAARAGDGGQALGGADDREVALLVRAQDADAEPLEHGEGGWRRMAVVVVLPDADQRHPRADRRVQRSVLLGRAVVRDLDDVHRGHASEGGDEGSLRIGLEVAQRQHRDAVDVGVHDEAGVVDPVVDVLAGRAAPGLRAGRPQEAPGQPRGSAVRAGGGGRHRGTRRPDRRRGGPEALGWSRARADQDRWAPTVPERARETVDVVGVEVRQDDEIQRRHVPAAEAAVDAARLRAGVDEDGSFGSAAQQHRVALTDVALHDAPVLRRATAHEAWRDHPAEDGGQHEQAGGPREPGAGAWSPSQGS